MREVAHSNPVSQAGFTMIPNAVMLRGDLSATAKIVYGYLKHLAWREHGVEVAPARETIAADLHLSEKTVTAAILQLKKAPVVEGQEGDGTRLVGAVQRGQGLTNAYVVNDPATPAEETVVKPKKRRSRKVKTTFLEGEDLPHPARARSLPLDNSKPSGAKAPVTGSEIEVPLNEVAAVPDPTRPPPVVLFDDPTKDQRQNLPLNALREECYVGESNPERIAKRVVPFLNGLKGTGERGIREIAWTELIQHATVTGQMPKVARYLEGREGAEEFELYVAAAIHVKSALFHEKMPGATMGPAALRDYWLDLARMPNPLQRRGGMTPDDIRRMDIG